MAVAQTVEQALKSARLYSDGVTYQVVQLPAAAITVAAGILAEIGEPFGALIADKDEVTLVLPGNALPDFERRLRDYCASASPYRLITFDVVLEPSLVGFLAHVSAALAQAGIPILPYAAFSRDHLLVPADQYDAAVAALNRLRA